MRLVLDASHQRRLVAAGLQLHAMKRAGEPVRETSSHRDPVPRHGALFSFDCQQRSPIVGVLRPCGLVAIETVIWPATPVASGRTPAPRPAGRGRPEAPDK